MSKPRLYFAHPVNVYDTELEKELLARVNERFPGREIVNPKDAEHEAGYKARGMAYFLEGIVPTCYSCVVLAFRDGQIGAGVYAEAQTIYEEGLLVWEISPSGEITAWWPESARCLTVEETRERIRNPDRSLKPY